MRLVIGDALHSLGELGSKGLRLDANGFLGIEKIDAESAAWSEGHPLSEAANMVIAGTVRKLGGFTFQELNLSMDDIKTMAQPAVVYSFITGFVVYAILAKAGLEPAPAEAVTRNVGAKARA